jgi:hypothetical protein
VARGPYRRSPVPRGHLRRLSSRRAGPGVVYRATAKKRHRRLDELGPGPVSDLQRVGMAFADAVIASGSVPYSFPPHNFVGYSWADGGCICNLDVASAVERCLDVTNEENITVDLFLDNYSGPLANYTKFKTTDVLERAYEIRGMDSSVWFIYNAMIAYPKVHFRYIVTPSQQMGPFLNFTKENVQFNLNLGYKDGEAILKETKDTRKTAKEMFEKRREIIFP